MIDTIKCIKLDREKKQLLSQVGEYIKKFKKVYSVIRTTMIGITTKFEKMRKIRVIDHLKEIQNIYGDEILKKIIKCPDGMDKNIAQIVIDDLVQLFRKIIIELFDIFGTDYCDKILNEHTYRIISGDIYKTGTEIIHLFTEKFVELVGEKYVIVSI
jgi:hypothetical protein